MRIALLCKYNVNRLVVFVNKYMVIVYCKVIIEGHFSCIKRRCRINYIVLSYYSS